MPSVVPAASLLRGSSGTATAGSSAPHPDLEAAYEVPVVWDVLWHPEQRESLLRGTQVNAPRQLAETTKNMEGEVRTSSRCSFPCRFLPVSHHHSIPCPPNPPKSLVPSDRPGKSKRELLGAQSAQNDDSRWRNQQCVKCLTSLNQLLLCEHHALYMLFYETQDCFLPNIGTCSDPFSSALQIQPLSPGSEVLSLAPRSSLLWHPAVSNPLRGVLVSQTQDQCSHISSLSWKFTEVIQNQLKWEKFSLLQSSCPFDKQR